MCAGTNSYRASKNATGVLGKKLTKGLQLDSNGCEYDFEDVLDGPLAKTPAIHFRLVQPDERLSTAQKYLKQKVIDSLPRVTHAKPAITSDHLRLSDRLEHCEQTAAELSTQPPRSAEEHLDWPGTASHNSPYAYYHSGETFGSRPRATSCESTTSTVDFRLKENSPINSIANPYISRSFDSRSGNQTDATHSVSRPRTSKHGPSSLEEEDDQYVPTTHAPRPLMKRMDNAEWDDERDLGTEREVGIAPLKDADQRIVS
ncbi:Uu.00g011950.m01.CDS01 [Anthostomella pinea]|uniref:Uu.00g011950.m01.CDS01 n=1 Tax=Anthostomella pinea TaxID=933095 RepID=A0AAI8VS35_9PEZI|nr:Uu.00g011950.m01.CDS01 [Anthostomella pinea]